MTALARVLRRVGGSDTAGVVDSKIVKTSNDLLTRNQGRVLKVIREMKEGCASASRGRRPCADTLRREAENKMIETTLAMGKFHGGRGKWGFPSTFDGTVTYSAI